MRSLSEELINETLTSRKVLAARFLALILNAIYCSDMIIGESTSDICVQNMFPPYLQSNSLYHRMGAALVVNCLARLYWQKLLQQ